MNLFEFFAPMLSDWLGLKAEKVFTAVHQNDPAYKQNLQRLIEQNQEFEEKRNEPSS
jgi:hypothetical protein